jgi:hypothetical protein
MSCEIVKGIVGSCDYSASGVERLWVANKLDVTGTTYNTTGELTGLTFTGGSTSLLYEIVPALDSCTFADDLVINGSRRNFLQTINFAVGSLDDETMQTLETIGLANLIAIVKSAEGSYRAFGLKGSGLRTTVMTEASGTNAGNDSSLAVSIAGNNKGKASFLTSALATSLGLV